MMQFEGLESRFKEQTGLTLFQCKKEQHDLYQNS